MNRRIRRTVSYALAALCALATCLVGALAYAENQSEPQPVVALDADASPVAAIPAPVAVPIPPVLLDPDGDWYGFGEVVMGAATARRWGFVVVLVILGGLAALLALGGRVWSGFTTDVGRAAISFAFALILPLAVVLAAGARLTWPLYWGGVMTTASASGLWSWGKKLGRALLARLGLQPPDATKPGGVV